MWIWTNEITFVIAFETSLTALPKSSVILNAGFEFNPIHIRKQYSRSQSITIKPVKSRLHFVWNTNITHQHKTLSQSLFLCESANYHFRLYRTMFFVQSIPQLGVDCVGYKAIRMYTFQCVIIFRLAIQIQKESNKNWKWLDGYESFRDILNMSWVVMSDT